MAGSDDLMPGFMYPQRQLIQPRFDQKITRKPCINSYFEDPVIIATDLRVFFNETSTVTFSNIQFGPALPGRVVACFFASGDDVAGTYFSAGHTTMGGLSLGPPFPDADSYPVDNDGDLIAGYWQTGRPSGTSGDIVFSTDTNNGVWLHLAVFAIYGIEGHNYYSSVDFDSFTDTVVLPRRGIIGAAQISTDTVPALSSAITGALDINCGGFNFVKQQISSYSDFGVGICAGIAPITLGNMVETTETTAVVFTSPEVDGPDTFIFVMT